MTLVNSLELAAWSRPSSDDIVPLTIFRMDQRSYGRLVDWTRARTGREDQPAQAVLRGLHEIVSLFVPDVVFVTIRNGTGLEMTFTGHVAADAGRQTRLRTALSTWLGTVYAGGTTPQQRGAVADSALREENWTVHDISMRLRGRGTRACDEPEDRMLWDALTAQAVRALAGRSVTFASGYTKRLVPTVPTTGAFEGVELVAFPPTATTRRTGGYWTEVVTIGTANFPERDGIFLVARTSIRNWGEVRSPTRKRNHRSLDVFLPQVPDLEELGPQRHGAFSMGVVVQDGEPHRRLAGRWEHKDDENVFGVLSRLTGLQDLPVGGGLPSYVSADGTWILPRLGSLHGDKYLPGGSGVSMSDRVALSRAVGRAVEPLGFEKLPPIERSRPIRGIKPAAPFAEDGELNVSQRRASLAQALRTVNGVPEGAAAALELFLFARREEAAVDLRAAVTVVLGQPAAENGGIMAWPDGLQVRLHVHAAGALSEALHRFEEPTYEDKLRFPLDSQWKAERSRRQQAGNRLARDRMEEAVRQSRLGVAGACCAVLEIPEEFKDRYDDPFLMAKQVLAGARFLPQVVLAKDMPDGEEDAGAAHRFQSAFGDLLRALGTVPMNDAADQGIAALTVAQINTSLSAGMRRQSQAVPLAAQVRDGVLWAALPDAGGLPDWRPYAEVYLEMTRGSHNRFDRTRKPDNQARFAAFWEQALRDMSNRGPALVLVDAATARQWMPGAANGKLAFDRLEVGSGNTPLIPEDLPGVRIIRFTSADAKLPSYYHEEDAGWVSGVFRLPGSMRTAFGFKQKPVTSQVLKSVLTGSRHPDPDADADGPAVRDYADRRFAAIDEACAFFLQAGDEPLTVLHKVNGLRGLHVQYDGQTSLPYPLHELSLLKNAITT